MSGGWVCLGRYPSVPPCGALGDTDTGAVRHIEETDHATGPDSMLAHWGQTTRGRDT